MGQDMQEVHTYKDWCTLLALKEGIKIFDNDGFRDIKNFNEEMKFTRKEFNKRALSCTIIGI